MRPISLTIEGLTAFRSPQSIDFSELDLFVITGPTGAGKTSILDAMTFALYGDVCRVKSGQLRDMISHGSTHLKVSLDFRVNGTHYRVARRLKKSGGGHEAQLVRVEGDTEVAEVDGSGIKPVNERIEAILGLDFAAFAKAVLLPQGAFHEFLKGDASARRQILISLLDLHRYERAGAKAREQARQLSVRLDERQSLIESEYGDATAERLKEARAAQKDVKKAYQDLQQIESRAKEKVALAQAADVAAAAASDAEDKFRSLDRDLDELAEELPALVREGAARHEAVVGAEQQVTATEKGLKDAQRVLAKTIDRVGDETTIARLQAAAEHRNDEQSRLADLNTQLEAAQKELAAATDHHTKTEAAAKAARDQLAKVTQRTATAASALELAAAVLECARAAADEAATRTHLEAMGRARDEARAAAKAAAEHVRHVERTNLASALRAGLKPGDSCPVCEATIATLPKVTPGVESLVKQAKQSAEDAEANGLRSEQSYASAKAGHDYANTRLVKAALPTGVKPSSVEAAEGAFADAEATSLAGQQELAAAQTLAVEAEKNATEADAGKREATTKAKGLERELKATKQRLDKAETDLGTAFAPKLPSDLEEQLAQRRARLREGRDAVAAAEEAHKVAQKAHAAALTDKRDHDALFADFSKRVAEMRMRAEMAIQALERLPTASLPTLPGSREDPSAQLDAIKICCASCIEAAFEATRTATRAGERAMRELTATIAPLEFELDGDVGELLDSISETREGAHRTLVESESVVSQVKEKIGKRTELEEAIKEDSVRRARYRTLGQELQQDHFIAFVLAESMERLAALATVELLRISGERYSLVPDEDGFDAVDHHNANERRSVATLSGGETFLASLSLALALAGSVRDLAGSAAAARLDAIFIDEGFGALDPETLEIVVDALERLREGERMVGVISHVDALAERIFEGFRVEKSGSSSRILVR